MIEIIKQLVEILGQTSPVVYVFAYGYLLGQILTPVLVFSGIVYFIHAFKSCTWWIVRDEVVKQIRKGRIVVDGKFGAGVDEAKSQHDQV
jgi:hypothetical protein